MGQLLGQLLEMLLCELRHSSCWLGLFQSSFVSVSLFYKTIHVVFLDLVAVFCSQLMDTCHWALLGSKQNFISTDQQFVT